MSTTDRGNAPPAGQGGLFLTQPLRPARIAGHLALLVLGAVVGAAGALVQAAWFPGGLLLALLGAAGLFFGGAIAMKTRAGAGSPAAGWLVAVVFLTTTRPEGDFVFAATAGTYLFLLGGLAAAVICATVAGAANQGDGPVRLGK